MAEAIEMLFAEKSAERPVDEGQLQHLREEALADLGWTDVNRMQGCPDRPSALQGSQQSPTARYSATRRLLLCRALLPQHALARSPSHYFLRRRRVDPARQSDHDLFEMP